MTSQGMVLRKNILVGGGQRRVELAPQHRPVFEEACYLIFLRWTALQLGVQNEWGGSRSAEKAQQLLQDVIGWFYNTKGARRGGSGRHAAMPLPVAACPRLPTPPNPPPPPAHCPADHEMCDLQDLLEDALQLDFNIQAEDDSPYQVARLLVNTHNQVAAGDLSFVEQMRADAARAAAAQAAAASQRVANGVPDADDDSSSEDEEEGSEDEGGSDAMDAEVCAGGGTHPRPPHVAQGSAGVPPACCRCRCGAAACTRRSPCLAVAPPVPPCRAARIWIWRRRRRRRRGRWWMRTVSKWCSARAAAGGGSLAPRRSHALFVLLAPLHAFLLLCSAHPCCRPPPLPLRSPALMHCSFRCENHMQYVAEPGGKGGKRGEQRARLERDSTAQQEAGEAVLSGGQVGLVGVAGLRARVRVYMRAGMRNLGDGRGGAAGPAAAATAAAPRGRRQACAGSPAQSGLRAPSGSPPQAHMDLRTAYPLSSSWSTRPMSPVRTMRPSCMM